MTGSLNTPLPMWAEAWVTALVDGEIRSLTETDCNEVNRVVRVDCGEQRYFLKLGPGLQREYDKLRWLGGRLPCPQPVGFTAHEDVDALLTSAIDGVSLAHQATSMAPEIIVSRLATTLLKLHATPITDWPFGTIDTGKVLVHGDACLPNFLYHNGELSGYIDVGDMAVGEPEVDLAAAVWSLQYNLGSGYGAAFLRAYGVQEVDAERVEALRLRYELG